MRKETLLRRLQDMRGRTLAVAAAIPVQQFEFRPRDGSMTVGEHLRHIASSERTLVGPCAKEAGMVRVPWDPEEWNPAGVMVEWVAHECHHLGQLYLHLRLSGVEPPPYQ